MSTKYILMNYLLLLSFLIFIIPLTGNAQIGPQEIIDNSSESTGISRIVSADLDHNGFNDIIASLLLSPEAMEKWAII